MAEFVKTAWNNDAAPGVSAQQLNRIEQGIKESHDPICVMVHNQAPQTLAAQLSKIVFSAPMFDPDGRWDPVGKTDISLDPGLYFVSAQIYCDEPAKITHIRMLTDGAMTGISLDHEGAASPDGYIRLNGLVYIRDVCRVWMSISATIGTIISGKQMDSFLHIFKIRG